MKVPYNGILKVVYATAIGDPIAHGETLDTVPARRRLEGGEIVSEYEALYLAAQAFAALAEATASDEWRRARDAAQFTLASVSVPDSAPYLFRRNTSGGVLSESGTQTRSTNSRPLVALRAIASGLARLYVNNDPGHQAGIFQTLTRLTMGPGNRIECEVGISRAGVVYLGIKVDEQYWEAGLPFNDGDLITLPFSIRLADFLRWPGETTWTPEQESEIFATGDGAAQSRRVRIDTGDRQHIMTRFDLAANLGSAGCRLLANLTPEPGSITYSLAGESLQIRLLDGSGWYWNRVLPSTSGSISTIAMNWNEFTLAASQPSGGATLAPDRTRPIQAMEIICGRNASVLMVEYLGDGPQQLPGEFAMVSEFNVVSRIPGVHTLSIGDVRVLPGPVLPYREEIRPIWFCSKGGESSWRGSPIVAQVPEPGLAAFWAAAQDAYAEEFGVEGPFMSAIEWEGETEFSTQHKYFNMAWESWNALTASNAAEAWFKDVDNAILPTVCQKWMEYLDGAWTPAIPAQWSMGAIALAGRGCLLANLAGANRERSIRLLQDAILAILDLLPHFLATSPQVQSVWDIAAVMDLVSLYLESEESLSYPFPSETGNMDSIHAVKIIKAQEFLTALNALPQAAVGFRFEVVPTLQS